MSNFCDVIGIECCLAAQYSNYDRAARSQWISTLFVRNDRGSTGLRDDAFATTPSQMWAAVQLKMEAMLPAQQLRRTSKHCMRDFSRYRFLPLSYQAWRSTQ